MTKEPRFIFVTGGVSSSLGKGIIAASLGKLLQAQGFSVTIQKLDPYLNIDPGTINPKEHGECFVTDDGAETDLDLGHYERFLNINTSQDNNITTGRIYQDILNQERDGKFLGKTIQVIPHITNAIKDYVYKLSKTGQYDIVITEIGGCVGDIESLPFIEALRQVKFELGYHRCVAIHLTLVPFLKAAGELKTKPTQHSVKELLEAGVQPDILVCRTEHQKLTNEIRDKIARFCNVEKNAVIEALDAETIYDVPIMMKKEELDERVLSKLKLPYKREIKIENWQLFLRGLKNPTNEVNIALIGKYVELPDAYKSINEALVHAGSYNECKVFIHCFQSKDFHQDTLVEKLNDIHGIIVAPGFGYDGREGKILATQYARENLIPFFGICLGMQCASIEFARNVLHLKDANSTEIDIEKHSDRKNTATHTQVKNPVIDLMQNQKELLQANQLKIKKYGGTMRLGAYNCQILEGSKAYEAYGQTHISERHRHRYEFNSKYLELFEKKGMIASGINPESKLIEIIELQNHPWFLGTQFHPELKSRVISPHPLFVNFIKAAISHKKELKLRSK